MNDMTPSTETAVATFAPENPVMCLTDAQAWDALLDRIKAEIAQHTPDTSTGKGRAAIKSLAYKVTRTRTAIDGAGKALNEAARAQINKVDESRRKIRTELDTMAEAVRAPLTAWEKAEEERKTRAKVVADKIAVFSLILPGDGSNLIADRIGALEALEISEGLFGDESGPLKHLRDKAVEGLRAALEHAKQREAEQAELARLREEKEAQERAEKERLAQERRDRLTRERAALEEQERSEREAEAASVAAAHKQREMEAEIARVEREKAEAVAKAEAETHRVKEAAEQAEKARQEEVERIRREQEARTRDIAHRSTIMGEAKQGLMNVGLDEPSAKRIVLAICAGEVPHVSVEF